MGSKLRNSHLSACYFSIHRLSAIGAGWREISKAFYWMNRGTISCQSYRKVELNSYKFFNCLYLISSYCAFDCDGCLLSKQRNTALTVSNRTVVFAFILVNSSIVIIQNGLCLMLFDYSTVRALLFLHCRRHISRHELSSDMDVLVVNFARICCIQIEADVSHSRCWRVSDNYH